jgi:uncharacterized protein (TIGR02145 family)
MGCNHHKLQNFQPGNDTLFPYSAGWRWTGNDSGKYCSVMCYEDGQYFPDGISHTRVAYFSNPGIQYQGVATGHADSGDNARTIREIKSVIANYREGCCPTVQASGFTSSSISDTTMTIGWTRGNGSSVLVVAKESSAVNACPVFGTTYVANTSFGSGTQIGIGNYVLYNGTGTSVNIKKLKVGTTYHFAIYEYKTDNKCYLSPALIGNSTTTSVYCTAGSNALPVVITAQTTLIKSYTATSGGTVNCDAGSAIIARGVCYSLHPIPTLADNFTINGADTGTFISNLTGLIPDTVYYVRAYITDSAGTVYGNERTFRTLLYYYGEWVTDYDGMSYASLILGNQQWLAWNLSVIHYNNGDPIPNIPLGSYWYNTTSGAFVNWGNSPITAEIYGRLYNYYAVVDSRNLCPVGWHVPSDAEWTILINYLGGSSVAGGKLKEAGTDHWNSPNTGATNRSGFTALPGGVADWDFFSYYVTFYSLRVNGYFWTSTEISGTSSARYKFLSKNSSTIGGGANPMYLGQSVRCIKN